MPAIATDYKENQLTVFIQQDIDHHLAATIRKEIDEKITHMHPKLLLLNFDAVEFMDSSGIGLIIGRFKMMKELGGKLTVTGLNQHLKKLVELSGIAEIINIKE